MTTSPFVSQPDPLPAMGSRSRDKVVWKHVNALISIGIQSVEGCVEIRRLSRVPGSHKRVSGVLLFNGEAIPLMSLPLGTVTARPRKSRHEEYAVVVSIDSRKFAIRSDEVPRMVSRPLCPDERWHRESALHIRQSHLERFLTRCLSCEGEGVLPKHGERTAAGTEATTEDIENGDAAEQQSALRIRDSCCAD